MKTSLFLTIFLFLGSLSQAEELVRLTAELLKEKNEKLVQAQSSRGEKTTKTIFASSSRDPLRDSTILALNGRWTFVPKGSIIHTPDRFKGRIVSKPEGKLVSFPEFLRNNYGWLSTREVTTDEILGNIEKPEAFNKALKNSNSIVVATRGKSPVSTTISQNK